MPKLQVFLPDGNEVTHELTEDVITIGRIPDNTIQIEDGSVSSHHAQITVTGGECHLKDLDSTNGTRVNDQQFTEGALSEGDRIRFGKIEAVFASDTAAAQRPLPAEESHAATPAASSHRPADFANASPFKSKKKNKDPIGAAVLGFTVLSMLVFGYAVMQVLALKAQ